MNKAVTRWLIALGLVLALLLSSASAAAAPAEKPGKGPPDLAKVVFVHYPKGLEAKGGVPGPPTDKPPKDDNGGGGKLWYKYSGIHWADSDIPVPYVVNVNYSFGDSSFVLDGIITSFQVWEDDPESYIDFTYDGSFDGIPSSFDGVGSMNEANEVGWASLSDYPGAIAVTMVWYNIFSGVIAEVDMALASELPWTQNIVSGDPDTAAGTAGFYDVQNIVTHEVGHWLLLEDLYQKPAGEQTMFGYGAMGEVKKRSLESGDEAGIREIYSGAEMP